jgi:small-conductance mechanosensitive channel
MNDIGNVSDIALRLNASNLITIGLVIVGACLLAVGSQRLLPWLAGKLPGRYRYHVLALVPVMRLLIIAAGIVLIVPQIIEPTFENLLALLAAFGVALGFALKDYVSSLVAGVVTLYEMPYRPGDWIEIEGTYGEVKSIGMRAATIVTPDDTAVVIPHLKLWDHPIFNANGGSHNLMCVADFYLHPRHDARLARETLLDVALTSPFLRIEQPVNVVVSEKPWGTHYRVKAYPIDPGQQFNFTTDLTVRGKAALSALGVEFAAYPPVESPGAPA